MIRLFLAFLLFVPVEALAQEAEAPLRLELLPDEKPYDVEKATRPKVIGAQYLYGEPITLLLKVKNFSRKDLLFWDDPAAFLSFEIDLSDGTSVYKWRHPAAQAAADSGAESEPVEHVIKAGKTYKLKIPLSDGMLPYHFEWLSVSVRYASGWRERLESQPGIEAGPWQQEELRSNDLVIHMSYEAQAA